MVTPTTSCPASCSSPATTLLSTPPDIATKTRMLNSPCSALGVSGRRRQLYDQAVQFVGHHDLTSQPGSLGQPKRQVQHVLLVLGRGFKLLEPGLIDDHVAGGASQRTLAGAFYIDTVLVGDL